MRKMMQVYSPIKTLVQDLKTELKLKNESEVVGYLIAIREIYKDKITLTQHNEAMATMQRNIDQQTL